eukprot:g6730.t1
MARHRKATKPSAGVGSTTAIAAAAVVIVLAIITALALQPDAATAAPRTPAPLLSAAACGCGRFRWRKREPLLPLSGITEKRLALLQRLQAALGKAHGAGLQYAEQRQRDPEHPDAELRRAGAELAAAFAEMTSTLVVGGCPGLQGRAEAEAGDTVSGPECVLEFQTEAELKLYNPGQEKLLKIAGDTHEYADEALYAEIGAALGLSCTPTDPTYVMCVGNLYQRLIILHRHHLRQPADASRWYRAAVALRGPTGGPLLPWPSEWHIGLDFRPGLRSMPYWEGADAPELAKVMERGYATIKAELGRLRAQEHGRWDQDDYFLQKPGAGAWTEVNLFRGGEWDPELCAVMPKTCEMLAAVPSVVGPQPGVLDGGTSTFHNQVAIFRMTPGTQLAPHAGPANYRLYCHLGLVVPPGPRLQVGPGPARAWEEGKALCFDDSHVHEAWHGGNASTGDRFVLMAAWWHPDLAREG